MGLPGIEACRGFENTGFSFYVTLPKGIAKVLELGANCYVWCVLVSVTAYSKPVHEVPTMPDTESAGQAWCVFWH